MIEATSTSRIRSMKFSGCKAHQKCLTYLYASIYHRDEITHAGIIYSQPYLSIKIYIRCQWLIWAKHTLENPHFGEVASHAQPLIKRKYHSISFYAFYILGRTPRTFNPPFYTSWAFPQCVRVGSQWWGKSRTLRQKLSQD